MIFYDLEYYNSTRSFKWHQFQVFAPLLTVTINGFMWNPAIWNEYCGFLENAYKRFIQTEIEYQNMFSMVILCALLLGSICLYVRSIFFMFFLGEIPYFIKKSHNRRFDIPVYPMAYIEMLLHMNFYWWFLWRGYFRTIRS